MRTISKYSVRRAAVVLSCLGLVFVLCNSVWPQEKKAIPRIKELQKKRLAVLGEAHDAAKKGYSIARASYEDVHATRVALLDARRDYADTKKERIKACDEAVQEAVNWHEFTKADMAAGHGSRVTELQAQAYVLESQIALEKAEADK
jgi:hypothetical protein